MNDDIASKVANVIIVAFLVCALLLFAGLALLAWKQVL